MAFMATGQPCCWPTICQRQLPVGSAELRHVHASRGACKGHCIVQDRGREAALEGGEPQWQQCAVQIS